MSEVCFECGGVLGNVLFPPNLPKLREYAEHLHLQRDHAEFLAKYNGIAFTSELEFCLAYPMIRKDREVERLIYNYQPKWPPSGQVYEWEIGRLTWLAGVDSGSELDLCKAQEHFDFSTHCHDRFIIIGGGDSLSRVCISIQSATAGEIFGWNAPYGEFNAQEAFAATQFTLIATSFTDFMRSLRTISENDILIH